MGFELNQYDKCLSNININKKQCTIELYVDDNKVSHVYSDVCTKLIDENENKFGKVTRT